MIINLSRTNGLKHLVQIGALLAFHFCASALIAQTNLDRSDLLVTNFDLSTNPGDDFFQYANGAWIKRNPIPATESAWGIGNVVQEELYLRLRKINEDAAANTSASHDQQQIGDFWVTATDEANADRVGIKPLASTLALIDAIKSVNDVIDVTFALQPLGVDAFCSVDVSQDEKQSDVMSVHLSQGGLGLPERDFYFNHEKGVAKIRKEYVAHNTRQLILLGRPEREAQTTAKRVMKFETALAKVSRKLEDLRDPEKNYHKFSPAEVTAKFTSTIGWDQRLTAMSLRANYVIVGQPEFFGALNRLLAKTPLPVLKDYLRLQFVSEYAPYLGKNWTDEDFKFNGEILGGKKAQRPRWKRVLDTQDHVMGLVLGKIFVHEYFPEQTKQRYSNLVEAIRSAYAERIDRLDWMSDTTKAAAHKKLAAVHPKVGYPDKWKDYSALVVGTNSYCENMMNSARWQFNDMISKFGKPVDRTEWEMNPQTYDAYYTAANNEIVLPAAMFIIPGHPDAELDDAFVYGYAAASTIGHEITHGFDDEGRHFDGAGNLTNWWTAQDSERFQKRAAVMVAQFNAYEALPGLHINGEASLGENLADYGGVLLGLDAFKKTEQYRSGKTIGGLSPIQRYYLGYAFSWLSHQRDEILRKNLLGDVHAPAKWRVNDPLSNIPDFYAAFGVKPGQPMYRAPDARVNVW